MRKAVSTITNFEAQSAGFDADASRNLLRQLLLSDEIGYMDVPYVLPCFYWIKTHIAPPHGRISPSLRMQCNERQRRLFYVFPRLLSVEDNAELAKNLTGADAFDNSLRLCAFLELSTELLGPFQVLNLLNRILEGRKRLQYGDLKVDHLAKASPSSISNLVATIVHSLGDHLATAGCKAREMQAVADALSLILALSGEISAAKVFHEVLPKLVAGEVALCYSLLLATGLADEAEMEELWQSLVQSMAVFSRIRQDDIPMAISAVVIVMYSCGVGTSVLFPWLYGEVVKRNLQVVAKRAWSLLGGNSRVWDDLAEETEGQWDVQRRMWRNREPLIAALWAEQMAAEAAGSHLSHT